jgi:DSF synthase
MTFLHRSYANNGNQEVNVDIVAAGGVALLADAFSYAAPGRAAPLPPTLAIADEIFNADPGQFEHLEVEIDEDDAALWYRFRETAPPHFAPEVLAEVQRMQRWMRRLAAERHRAGRPALKFAVQGSRIPGIYNLGGDLALFSELIRSGDRRGLQRYAYDCVQVCHGVHVGFGLPLITIGLVQGDALGGGFESVLACSVIIAERRAMFGLPEVLFNLFPGMGAYSFLSRRLDATRAEKLILGGKVYTAIEMHEMGIVDVLAEDGGGEDAVRDYLDRTVRRHNAHEAVMQARRRANAVTIEEMHDITDIWVEAALRLTDTDMRRMAKLVVAQARRRASLVSPLAVAAE